MADYWKSNPRKYCEVCKCWFGDNQASISFHEQGRRHKANVQRQLKEARNKSSETEQDKKKTEKILATIEHAAIAAYHKDLTTELGELPVQEATVRLVSEEDEQQKRVLDITTALAAEKQREVEKNTIKENIDKKVQKLKQEAMSWQPLLTPEGYTYYYNYMTGVTQWEPPAGYTPAPQTQQIAHNVPTSSVTSEANSAEQEPSQNTNGETDPDSTSQKRPATQDNSDEGPSSPKRSRPSGPYGGWQTVVEYEVQETVEEKPAQEVPAEGTEKELAIQFEERTLPVNDSIKTEEEGYSGGFKKFSFKKKGSGRPQIRQRTSELT